MKALLSIQYYAQNDMRFGMRLDTWSPRPNSECSLNKSSKGGVSYDIKNSASSTSTSAGREDIASWHGGDSSSKRKQLRNERFILSKMKRLQPEKEKNLDGLRYWDSLRGIFGPYYLPLAYQPLVALSQDLSLGDGTFKLTRL